MGFFDYLLGGAILLGSAFIKSKVNDTTISEELGSINDRALSKYENVAKKASHNRDLSPEKREHAADVARELRERRQEDRGIWQERAQQEEEWRNQKEEEKKERELAKQEENKK